MAPIDQVQLHFNPQTLTVLNAVLGLVMFGVALDLKVEDFRSALKTPKALALGLLGHHVLFPAMTYVLVWILQPQPSIALGMILVSSCPAGHISNFLVHFSRGNTALSVSVSALSTLAALVMTPLNFTFWGNLSPVTRGLMQQVAMSPWEMLEVVVLLLGVPLVLGMGVAHRYPGVAARIRKPMKWLSLLVLVGFIVGALAANFRHFLAYIQFVLLVVFIHNLLALATGYSLSAALGLPERDRRAITFEMGLRAAFPPAPELEPLWQRASRRGLLMGRMAQQLGVDAWAAHSAGLFEECGKAVLLKHALDHYRSMLRAAATDLELVQLEHVGFGVSHDALGAALCESWGLGPAAVASVRHHVYVQAGEALPMSLPRRGVAALSAVAHALMGDAALLPAVLARVAPQVPLDEALVLRAAQKVAEQLAAD